MISTDLTRYAEVRAALTDPAYTVPAVCPSGPAGTMAWLRTSAPRFRSGAGHADPRAATEAVLAAIDPEELRAAAAVMARALARPLPMLARHVPVAVLAGALGVSLDVVDEVVDVVGIVAAGYLTGPADVPAADRAVARLCELVPAPDGRPAVRIAVLVQAYAATAGLVLAAAPLVAAGRPVEEALAEALREEPPARQTFRVAPAGGTVRLDLAAANRDPDAGPPLSFGAGAHACPGAAHALAIATGLLSY